MESRPQNPEFRITGNPENFHPCIIRMSRYFTKEWRTIMIRQKRRFSVHSGNSIGYIPFHWLYYSKISIYIITDQILALLNLYF